MASPNINYQALNETRPEVTPSAAAAASGGSAGRSNEQQHHSHDYAEEAAGNDVEDEDEYTPRDSGVMLHTIPEINKARWNHIEDLDSFFTRMYNYHQKHGFVVIVLDEVFQLVEFAFVIWLITFTIHCVNHEILFGRERPKDNHTKITINDVIKPMDQCVDSFSALTYFVLLIATFYIIIRTVKVLYHITQYWDIKKFYNTALHIDDDNLDNITWHDVKKKVREVQAEQHMCIDKDHLTDLDIYHRILRFKNYLVALMNKNLLPVRFHVPLMGEVVSLSRGLLINIDLILFRSPGSPFQNNWQLRDDYAVRGNQVELAKRLSNLIFWLAIANFILSPVIFVWQLIYFAFTYANILKKEPGALGMRTWSNYGRLYLRHFNELDHELDARLNRAYEYSDRYLSSFSSPLMAVIARNILFISGGMLLLLLLLGIYDEYVFQVEHILTIITLLSAIGLLCRNLIPDENLIWCPEQLMTAILAHVHYLPATWKNQAHTTIVRNEFGNFFQFKAAYFLNEIFSPIITPFQLMFVFRPKALEIVKFFRSFTVSVRGVGNVCSFAQMDVRKHGNPEWQLDNSNSINTVENVESIVNNGKTELSLLRFTLTNPEWQMPPDALQFVNGIRQSALSDLTKAKKPIKDQFGQLNPLTESLVSFGTIGEEYSSVAKSVMYMHNIGGRPSMEQSQAQAQCQCNFEQMLQQNLGDQSHFNDAAAAAAPSSSMYMSSNRKMMSSMRGTENMKKFRVSKVEGSLQGPQQSQSLIYSLYGGPESLADHRPNDLTVADMCLSALYMHEIHRTKRKRLGSSQSAAGGSGGGGANLDVEAGPSSVFTDTIVTSKRAVETTPLLGIRS